MLQPTNLLLNAMLKNMLATAQALGGGVTVHLYQNMLSPTPNSQVSDFTEATFTGYTEQTVTAADFIGPIQQPGNVELMSAPLQSWVATDGATPNIIYGYYVVGLSTGYTSLLWAELAWPAGIPVAGAGQGVQLVPQLQMQVQQA